MTITRMLLGAALTAGLGLGAIGQADAATLHTSQIIGFSYDPEPLTVTVGDSVQWFNIVGNTEHTATVFAMAPTNFGFDTDIINAGANSTPVEMTTPGTFTVVCTLHGLAMRQTLIVQAVPPAEIPEAATPVLFGLVAAAGLGGTVWFRRRRASMI